MATNWGEAPGKIWIDGIVMGIVSEEGPGKPEQAHIVVVAEEVSLNLGEVIHFQRLPLATPAGLPAGLKYKQRVRVTLELLPDKEQAE